MTGLHCASCGKHLAGEPNFCPACGDDLRGLSPTSQTLSGPHSGKVVDGRYQILEKLGEGGMGSVYKVEHVRMGKVLALKVLRPDSALDKSLKKRFSQEARALARLSHQNTVQVFDHGELDDGSLYIAMEYLPGRDLSFHLRAHGALSEERAVTIGTQVLSSLVEAHSLGIVHRDLKPANIMLVRRNEGGDLVKLLDFGIAKMLENNESRKSITGVTDFLGTPAYMSPEQARGDELDARSDLYSLGAVLFELVTGREVFVAPTPMSVVTMHLTAPPPHASHVASDKAISPGLDQVLYKALQKDPDDRYRDADAMRAALEKVRRELGAQGSDFTPMPEALAASMARREDFEGFERRLRLRRSLAPVAALLVLAASGAAAWRLLTHGGSAATSEREPNDQLEQASLMKLGQPISGAIGAAASGANDRDLFVLDVPEGPLRVSLTGVEDLNLTLELLQLEPEADGQKLRRRLFLDDEAVGAGERVDAFFARAGPLYLRVEERAHFTEAPRPPREKGLVPYSLLVERMDGSALEEEPNDTPGTAQSTPLTVALTGFTGARVEYPDAPTEPKDAPASARDYFEVEVARETDKVAVLVVPPPKGKLLVFDGVHLEGWLSRREAGGPGARASPPPRPLVVEGKPALLQLSAAGGRRRVRVQGGDDCAPGSSYHLAFLTEAPNGLASVIDLAKTLEAEGRGPVRQRALELAANEFASAELKAVLERKR